MIVGALAEARANLRLAGPLIAAQLAAVGMGAVDIVFAGHISADALAAVAVGANINTVPLVFFAGFFMAAAALVAKRRGDAAARGLSPEQAAAAVGPFLRSLLLLALGVGLLWVLGVQLLAPRLVATLQLPAATSALAVDYLRVYCLSGIGFCLWFALRYCAEGLATTKPVMLVGLAGFAINAALNPVLIYGFGPLPALGVIGSGLATALATLSMALMLMAVYFRHRSLRGVRLLGRGWDARAVPDVARLGLPIATTLTAEAGLFVVVSLLMARFGAGTMAAHQVALNIASVLFMIPLGLALATTVRVAYFHGAGDAPRARTAAWTGVVLGSGNAVFNAAVMVFAGAWLTAVYTQDAEVAQRAQGFLLLAAAFQIFDGMQATAAGALRGYQDTAKPMWITLAAYWLVGMPIASWLAFSVGLGADGLWWGLTAGLAAAALGLTVRIFLTMKIHSAPK